MRSKELSSGEGPLDPASAALSHVASPASHSELMTEIPELGGFPLLFPLPSLGGGVWTACVTAGWGLPLLELNLEVLTVGAELFREDGRHGRAFQLLETNGMMKPT